MLDLAKGLEAGALRANGFFKPGNRLLGEYPHDQSISDF
jgi:hypothetical protein